MPKKTKMLGSNNKKKIMVSNAAPTIPLKPKSKKGKKK
jgi:hypothetical protein